MKKLLFLILFIFGCGDIDWKNCKHAQRADLYSNWCECHSGACQPAPCPWPEENGVCEPPNKGKNK